MTLVPIADHLAKVATIDPRVAMSGEFTYIEISAIDADAKQITNARKVVASEAPSRARQVVKTGDVIVATTRPNLNAVAIVPPHLDGQLCSTGFAVLRCRESLDAPYLYAFVQSPGFVNSLTRLVAGALYPAVTDADVRAQLIPLPSLETQRVVAARVARVLADRLRLRSAVAHRLAEVERLRDQVVDLSFKVPHFTERTQLGRLGALTDGDWILNADYTSSGVRLLQVGDIGQSTLRLKSKRFISAERAIQLNCTMLRPGDILISRMADPIGRACILPDLGYPAITAVDVTIFRPRLDLVDVEFVTAFMNSRSWYEAVLARSSGATRPRISRRNLGLLSVPLPDLATQRRIAAELRERLATIDAITRAIDAQLEAIDALPAALLRRVFADLEAA